MSYTADEYLSQSDTPWDRIINQEVVSKEILRTLIGCIGLIASVPLTKLSASLIAERTKATPSKDS